MNFRPHVPPLALVRAILAKKQDLEVPRDHALSFAASLTIVLGLAWVVWRLCE